MTSGITEVGCQENLNELPSLQAKGSVVCCDSNSHHGFTELRQLCSRLHAIFKRRNVGTLIRSKKKAKKTAASSALPITASGSGRTKIPLTAKREIIRTLAMRTRSPRHRDENSTCGYANGGDPDCGVWTVHDAARLETVWAYALVCFLVTDRVKLGGYHFPAHAKAAGPKEEVRTDAPKSEPT